MKVIGGVALGKGPGAKVKEVMSGQVKYCFEDEDLDHVSQDYGLDPDAAFASNEP